MDLERDREKERERERKRESSPSLRVGNYLEKVSMVGSYSPGFQSRGCT